MYFNTLAEILINTINDPHTNTAIIHDFGFGNIFRIEHQQNYTGVMASPDYRGNVNQKQGLFDIKVFAGTRYGFDNVTHHALFQDLYANSSWENCYYIWAGYNPFELTNNFEEQQCLLALSLLMFEQEINWGNQSWQKWTWFSPSTINPYKRPRDMILGVIRFMYDNYGNIDAYPYWNSTHTTPTFGGSFTRMPKQYRRYFSELSDWDDATPLMSGEYLDIFLDLSNNFEDNPHY